MEYNTASRLISLGYSVQTHRVILKQLLAIQDELNKPLINSEKVEALVADCIDDCKDALNFDKENGGE